MDVWVDDEGNRVTDAGTLERLRALALPPAWKHVWASADPGDRVQARGIDSKGRVQYRYSKEATERAAQNRFDHMFHFAESLPTLRADVQRELRRRPGAPDEQQLTALAVRLLDLALFRIGTARYTKENKTFGLTTLEPRHVAVKGKKTHFDYIGKEHIHHQRHVEDASVARVMRAQLDARGTDQEGPLLLAEGDPGRWVNSATVNSYMHSISGSGASAKVFRTWGATVIAAATMAGATFEGEKKHRDPTLKAYDAASRVLGNTPTMARNSYVYPGAVSLGENEAVRKAVQQAAERTKTDNVARIFSDPDLQATVLTELHKQDGA